MQKLQNFTPKKYPLLQYVTTKDMLNIFTFTVCFDKRYVINVNIYSMSRQKKCYTCLHLQCITTKDMLYMLTFTVCHNKRYVIHVYIYSVSRQRICYTSLHLQLLFVVLMLSLWYVPYLRSGVMKPLDRLIVG